MTLLDDNFDFSVFTLNPEVVYDDPGYTGSRPVVDIEGISPEHFAKSVESLFVPLGWESNRANVSEAMDPVTIRVTGHPKHRQAFELEVMIVAIWSDRFLHATAFRSSKAISSSDSPPGVHFLGLLANTTQDVAIGGACRPRNATNLVDRRSLLIGTRPFVYHQDFTFKRVERLQRRKS